MREPLTELVRLTVRPSSAESPSVDTHRSADPAIAWIDGTGPAAPTRLERLAGEAVRIARVAAALHMAGALDQSTHRDRLPAPAVEGVR